MVFAIAHLTIAAIWLGSMTYSLGVVQPKVTRFFSDDRQREEFLTTLAQGNRWKVVGLICALVVTAIGVIVTGPPEVASGYAMALGLYVVAAAVFADVSWRHWPARIFARVEELPGYRRQLQLRARTMLVLVAAAFLIALYASVRWPSAASWWGEGERQRAGGRGSSVCDHHGRLDQWRMAFAQPTS